MHHELRRPTQKDLSTASQLCLRSKAHWGYSQSFLDACVEELTLTKEDLEQDEVVIATSAAVIVGVAHVSIGDQGCHLEKLFVDPDRMGEGIGRALYRWAIDTAQSLAARELTIEADPDAVPFYLRMGASHAGHAESNSIPGRLLPRLVQRLPFDQGG